MWVGWLTFEWQGPMMRWVDRRNPRSIVFTLENDIETNKWAVVQGKIRATVTTM